MQVVTTQSFPIESRSWPLLWQGSYSKRERYTQAQLIDLVQYGKERGVRVIPEYINLVGFCSYVDSMDQDTCLLGELDILKFFLMDGSRALNVLTSAQVHNLK